MAETLADLRSRYTWDARFSKYRNARGQFVSQKALKQSFNTFAKRMQREIESLGRQVASGAIEIADWQTATAFRVKNAALAMRAAGRGGWAQLDKSDFGQVGQELRFTYAKLNQFAADVQSFKLTPKQIVARAGMYGRASAASYERARHDDHVRIERTGVTVEMRNVLGIGEHCSGTGGRPGCKEESARGWVPLGQLSLPGSRRCLSNCLCSVNYRTR